MYACMHVCIYITEVSKLHNRLPLPQKVCSAVCGVSVGWWLPPTHLLPPVPGRGESSLSLPPPQKKKSSFTDGLYYKGEHEHTHREN